MTTSTSGLGAKQYTLGYSYGLSKRTDLYGFYTRVANESGATYQFANAAGIGAAAGAAAEAAANAFSQAAMWPWNMMNQVQEHMQQQAADQANAAEPPPAAKKTAAPETKAPSRRSKKAQ